MASERERISHVFRRLGYGAQPELVENATTVEEAKAVALDLSAPPPAVYEMEPPQDLDAQTSRSGLAGLIGYWFEQMVGNPRRIEERLVWFWHDHFATDVRKVRVAYLMHTQHQTVRTHATGNFADLLQAMAVDPALLIYLDGVQNQRGAINENFGREAMELFTLGRGHYTEEDVVAASRAFSGWIVLRPGGRAERLIDGDPWSSQFVPFRHDGGQKTLLGTTGHLDADEAIEILLEQDRTAEFIGAKLFTHLVGHAPSDETAQRIGTAFRRRYEIMDLVNAIVEEPAFLDDTAIFARVRSPLEKAVGLAQAFPGVRLRAVADVIRTLGYVPFGPPNVAGFPDGEALLDPHRLIHTFDLTQLLPPDLEAMPTVEIMNRLGIYDISANTAAVLETVDDPGGRFALAVNSPEYHRT